MSTLWMVRCMLVATLVQILGAYWIVYSDHNRLSYVWEVVVIGIAIYFRGLNPVNIVNIISYILLGVVNHFILYVFFTLFRLVTFYVLRSVSHKRSLGYNFWKKHKKFVKISRYVWKRINYGFRIKRGTPYLVNRSHPKTKVYFNGLGFPKFKYVVELKIPKSILKKSRETHFAFANRWLKEEIEKKSKLGEKFSKSQIRELEAGETPSGYVWHHSEEKGVLQLVDAEIHSQTPHKGGYSLWGPKKI